MLAVVYASCHQWITLNNQLKVLYTLIELKQPVRLSDTMLHKLLERHERDPVAVIAGSIDVNTSPRSVVKIKKL